VREMRTLDLGLNVVDRVGGLNLGLVSETLVSDAGKKALASKVMVIKKVSYCLSFAVILCLPCP